MLACCSPTDPFTVLPPFCTRSSSHIVGPSLRPRSSLSCRGSQDSHAPRPLAFISFYFFRSSRRPWMRASAKRPVCNCKRWDCPHVGPLVTAALKKAAVAAARGGLDKMEAGSHYNQSFSSFGGDIHCLAVCSQIQREPLWPAGFHISLKPLGHPPPVPLSTLPRPHPVRLPLVFPCFAFFSL